MQGNNKQGVRPLVDNFAPESAGGFCKEKTNYDMAIPMRMPDSLIFCRRAPFPHASATTSSHFWFKAVQATLQAAKGKVEAENDADGESSMLAHTWSVLIMWESCSIRQPKCNSLFGQGSGKELRIKKYRKKLFILHLFILTSFPLSRP